MKNKTIDLTNFFIRKGPLSRLAPKEALKIIRKHARELRKHMSTDGWDLDYTMMMEVIYHDLLGFNAELAFMTILSRTKGPTVTFDFNGPRIMVKKVKGAK